MSESSTKDKRLYDAIREIVDNQGKSVIEDVRFVNILDDVMSFDNIPAVKPVIKDLIKKGIGNKIIKIDSSGESFALKKQSLLVSIVNNNGYNFELVRYILDCMSYGLHWTNKIPNSFVSYQKDEGISSIVDFKEEMAKLKIAYTTLLKSTITIPSNTSGYYTASALTDIYYLSDKIRIIADVLHTDDYNCCLDEKKKILEEYYVKPAPPKKRGLFSRLFGKK